MVKCYKLVALIRKSVIFIDQSILHETNLDFVVVSSQNGETVKIRRVIAEQKQWRSHCAGLGSHVPSPPFQFLNQTKSKNFSFKRQGYCCSLRMLRNYKEQTFHNFYRVWYNFWTTYGVFSFFLTTQGKQITLRWTF